MRQNEIVQLDQIWVLEPLKLRHGLNQLKPVNRIVNPGISILWTSVVLNLKVHRIWENAQN